MRPVIVLKCGLCKGPSATGNARKDADHLATCLRLALGLCRCSFQGLLLSFPRAFDGCDLVPIKKIKQHGTKMCPVTAVRMCTCNLPDGTSLTLSLRKVQCTQPYVYAIVDLAIYTVRCGDEEEAPSDLCSLKIVLHHVP